MMDTQSMVFTPLSTRERARMRGKCWIMQYRCPLIRPVGDLLPHGEETQAAFPRWSMETIKLAEP